MSCTNATYSICTRAAGDSLWPAVCAWCVSPSNKCTRFHISHEKHSPQCSELAVRFQNAICYQRATVTSPGKKTKPKQNNNTKPSIFFFRCLHRIRPRWYWPNFVEAIAVFVVVSSLGRWNNYWSTVISIEFTQQKFFTKLLSTGHVLTCTFQYTATFSVCN